jgi:hypothetical protein
MRRRVERLGVIIADEDMILQILNNISKEKAIKVKKDLSESRPMLLLGLLIFT